jgi:hypothetical protein
MAQKLGYEFLLGSASSKSKLTVDLLLGYLTPYPQFLGGFEASGVS